MQLTICYEHQPEMTRGLRGKSDSKSPSCRVFTENQYVLYKKMKNLQSVSFVSHIHEDFLSILIWNNLVNISEYTSEVIFI